MGLKNLAKMSQSNAREASLNIIKAGLYSRRDSTGAVEFAVVINYLKSVLKNSKKELKKRR